MVTPLFLLLTIGLFCFGASIGSFLNVIIYRTVHGQSWVRGRSKCEQCGKHIYWFDNIPLLSFVLLRGRCRFCQTPLSLSHPFVESITGALFVWWFWIGSVFFQLTQQPFSVIQPAFWLIVGLCLLVIFFADIRYYIIPDEVVGLLTFLTISYRIALLLAGVMQPIDFFRTILGSVIICGCFYTLWRLTHGKGMGFGDVKFAVPFGLLLGWPNVFVGTFFAFFFGSVVGLVLIFLGKKTLKQVVPFGPFLVGSTFFTLIWGSSFWQWYMSLLH